MNEIILLLNVVEEKKKEAAEEWQISSWSFGQGQCPTWYYTTGIQGERRRDQE